MTSLAMADGKKPINSGWVKEEEKWENIKTLWDVRGREDLELKIDYRLD